MTKSKNGMLIALVGFLAYLILGTGLHGDDFAIIAQFADWSFEDWIIPDPAQQGINLSILRIFFLGVLAIWQ